MNLALAEDLLEGARLNQIQAISALKEKLKDPEWNLTGYFVQPTGAGKTVLFGILVKALECKTLILVPKINLLLQSKNELVDFLHIPEDEIGLVGMGYKEFGRKITISTYQSHLANYRSDSNYKQKLAEIELLICDEAHRSLGDLTQETLQIDQIDTQITDKEAADEEQVMSNVDQQFGREVLKLAFTATPKLSAKSVRDVFGETEIARESYANLVRSGVLVPFRIFHTEGKVIIEKDYNKGSPITLSQESRILEREESYQKLLTIYADLKQSSKERLLTAVFCASINECDKFMELAERKYGLKCIRVTSKDDKEALSRAEEGLKNGTIDLVVTVDKLTEGWNFPPLNTIINARATNSLARLLQGSGRASRSHPGKEYANIIETNWQVVQMVNGKASINSSPSGGGSSRDPKNEFQTQLALNLLEALLNNGESSEMLGIMCRSADGSEFQYVDLNIQQREEIIEQLKRDFTPENWAALDSNAKLSFRFKNLSLYTIAKLVGINGKHYSNHQFHLELGKVIWGDLPCFTLQSLSRECVIARLQQMYTPDVWSKMTSKDRLGVKLLPENKGIIALSNILGLQGGNPLDDYNTHIEMGRIIWGEKNCELEYLSSDTIITNLKAKFTIQQWLSMDKPSRQAYRYQEDKKLSFKMLARHLNVYYPKYDDASHLEMGRKIWGDLECFKEKNK